MKKICTMMLALVVLIFSGQAKAADFEVDYGNSIAVCKIKSTK